MEGCVERIELDGEKSSGWTILAYGVMDWIRPALLLLTAYGPETYGTISSPPLYSREISVYGIFDMFH